MAAKEFSNLTELLAASDVLLERVYEACKGFPAGSACQSFVDTFREASYAPTVG